MKRLTPLFLLASLGLLLCGCINNGALVVAGLRVELSGIERAADGTVSVSWRVVNPNIAPYLVAQVSHTIYLNGTLVGTIATNDPLGIPPQESAARSSKLVPAGPAADQILAAAVVHGTATYRVDSKLVIQIYGDDHEKGELSNSGSVTVTTK